MTPSRSEITSRLVLVVLPAEIDITNAAQVRTQLSQEFQAGRAVIADLTATMFCDSSGTVALLRASRDAVALGGELRLAVSPAGQVSRVLELTGFAAQLRLYASVAEATAA